MRSRTSQVRCTIPSGPNAASFSGRVRRSHAVTIAPACANRIAVARPIPLAPPVTTATRPANDNIDPPPQVGHICPSCPSATIPTTPAPRETHPGHECQSDIRPRTGRPRGKPISLAELAAAIQRGDIPSPRCTHSICRARFQASGTWILPSMLLALHT